MISEAMLHPKMEGTSSSSGVGAAETEAAGPLTKQSSTSKSKKTRAEKDKHNESCRRSRLNIKRKREELEQEVPELKAENKKMKMELVEKESKLQDKENEIQQIKRNLEAKTAEVEQMRRIITRLKVNGRNFSSLEESVEYFVSQDYVQDGSVLATSATGLQTVDEFGLSGGEDRTSNFQPLIPGFYQQMISGQYYCDIAADTAVDPSLVANHAPSHHGKKAGSTMFADQDYPNFTASTTAAAASSSVADHDLTIPSSHHGDLTIDGSSLGANPEMELDPYYLDTFGDLISLLK